MKKEDKREIIKTDLVPRGKSVLIKRKEFETKAESGIIIPESAKEPRPTGILVAAGADCPQDLKDGIGKLVTFNRYANLELIDGYNNTLLMMHDADVQCWISDNTVFMDESGKKEKRIDIKKD